MLRKILLIGLAVAVLGSLPEAPGDEPYFIWLGHLPDIPSSQAHAVSDDGTVVVGEAGWLGQAFRWTSDEGMVGLGFLPSGNPGSGAWDVSADGSVVAGTSTSDELGFEAFRWTPETGMVGLGAVPGAHADTQASGVSGDGSVIVGAARAGFVDAVPFRWTEAEGMQRLDQDARGATPSAISQDGSVIVGTYTWQGMQPFRWTAEAGLEVLGPLPGGNEEGWGINVSADGSVVVGWANPGEPSYMEAFRWTADEGMVGLGFLPVSDFSMARDVSGDGSVIVGEAPINGPGSDAFIWTATTGMRDLQRVLALDLGLDMEGVDLYNAYGVSTSGRYIVGAARNADGVYEACLAYLGDPIPCRGDLNADGQRDLTDIGILLAAYGIDGGGDIDGDGDTDLRDLAWLLAVHGEQCLE